MERTQPTVHVTLCHFANEYATITVNAPALLLIRTLVIATIGMVLPLHYSPFPALLVFATRKQVVISFLYDRELTLSINSEFLKLS